MNASGAQQEPDWVDLGPEAAFRDPPLQQVRLGTTAVAVSWRDGVFGAISGVCNHVGGPLGEGRLQGEYVECPWHYWKFHHCTGVGEPGFEADQVPRHLVKVEAGRLFVSRRPVTKRAKSPHAPHALEREPVRAPGPPRVLGISTTSLDPQHPRYSTSEALLESALAHAREAHGAEARLIRLAELEFRPCEGFYSRAAQACTWPCSITQMDPEDQLTEVYEGLVHWADVVLLATPIRWGSASALYFKMVERMNCIQNQITIRDRVLIRDKVAAFVITGGQDNVQGVAGQLLSFFAELGFVFPPFPYVAHSRGWSAEDMENNVRYVQDHAELHEGARQLVERALGTAAALRDSGLCSAKIERGGRKAHRPHREPTGTPESNA
ncbi:MAG TPA: NAD(P)H-dependent oxidoreductase [Planctomycetota bacterium]